LSRTPPRPARRCRPAGQGRRATIRQVQLPVDQHPLPVRSGFFT
jgi:hypothetical protein